MACHFAITSAKVVLQKSLHKVGDHMCLPLSCQKFHLHSSFTEFLFNTMLKISNKIDKKIIWKS